MTDQQIKDYVKREHEGARAWVALWTDLSNGVVDDKILEIAESYVREQLRKNGMDFNAFSAGTQDALIELQCNAWAGREPSANTVAWVVDVLVIPEN